MWLDMLERTVEQPALHQPPSTSSLRRFDGLSPVQILVFAMRKCLSLNGFGSLESNVDDNWPLATTTTTCFLIYLFNKIERDRHSRTGKGLYQYGIFSFALSTVQHDEK